MINNIYTYLVDNEGVRVKVIGVDVIGPQQVHKTRLLGLGGVWCRLETEVQGRRPCGGKVQHVEAIPRACPVEEKDR